MKNAFGWMALLAITALLVGLGASPRVLASSAAATVDGTEVRIFRLQHAQAREISPILSQLGDGVHTMADARTNSVIVQTTAEQMEAATRLIESLDQPVETKPEEHELVQVFPIQHQRAIDVLQSLMPLVTDARTRIASDETTNQLMISGQPRALQHYRSIIEQLDQPQPGVGAPTEVTVRIAWLVTSDDAGARPLPDDMTWVEEEMAATGYTNLRLGAQTGVRTTTGEEFSSRFFTEVDGNWAMQLQGLVEAIDGERRLSIIFEGSKQHPKDPNTRIGGRSSSDVISLETTITTQSGHWVVLGVSPAGSWDSVLVLQVNDYMP